MKVRLFGREPGATPKVLAVLVLFFSLGVAQYWTGTGDDLAASYVGCRLLAEGHPADLYSYSPGEFADIGTDAAWKATAAEGGFNGFLHPYVQTPLWANALRPLCTRTRFTTFNRIFDVLTMLSFAGCLWLIAAFWAPDLMNPYAMSMLCLGLYFSEPFRYAMFLMQTHVLFFLLILAALALAERRPLLAGMLLAGAAAIKITPGALLIYWLLTRRWRAAGSMVLCSGLLWGLTLATSGQGLMTTYLADLHRISETLLISLNNQSFVAWAMARFYDFDEIFDLQIFPLPAAIRVGSSALLILCTFVGGLMDRNRETRLETAAPVGAMFALVGATLFSPIAWTHYFIILIAPLMMLAQENRVLRSRWLWILLLAIASLNFQPLAADIENNNLESVTLLRGHFFSGVLCLVALALATILRRRRMRNPSTQGVADRLTEVAA